jgi:hypothetical protein
MRKESHRVEPEQAKNAWPPGVCPFYPYGRMGRKPLMHKRRLTKGLHYRGGEDCAAGALIRGGGWLGVILGARRRSRRRKVACRQ